MLLATQTHREIAVKSALADDVLVFKHMLGTEQLGRMFEFRITLASSRLDIKIGDLLGKDMTVTLDSEDGAPRHFNGIVTRFSYKGWRDGSASYEAVVHPALWLLTRSSNCRIFQEKSALDIVKSVCAAGVYGGLVVLDAGALSGTPLKRGYCVQYRETDFNFVCRLLEEEGIYFYFTHADGKHTMVLADSYGAHASVSGYASVPFRDEDGRPATVHEEAVTAWSPSGQIEASSFAMNDFDFEKASASTSGALLVKTSIAAAFAQEAFDQYDYPGLYRSSDAGHAATRARMEAIHGQCEQIDARASARGIATGALFTLTDHPRDDQNRDYLVTSAQFDLTGVDYRSGGSGGVQFDCRFTAIGKDHSYRAPPGARKPFVQGPQTAMVVGKAGEEIWTDKYGRIKVQFHWDRDGKSDETSSCWVRVSHSLAGKGWGAIAVPRIGMEVVVDFLEGDPDQPLVTGCVYNGDAMPPYALPAEQTKSTFKSNTSKGGAGYNEIRFEDKKDAEEVYVQAEKDYNRVVKNNDSLKVGFEKKDKGDQSIAICNDQSLDVGNDRKVHVKNDQTTDIDHDLTAHIKNNETRTVDKDQSLKIDGGQKTKVGTTCVIEAGTSIELKVGGSSIKIEAAKITIKSVQIAVEADATMALKAGAMLTAEGALVKIN